MKITKRQREVLAAWAAPASSRLYDGFPYVLHRQLTAGNEHHQGMMLHGLRTVCQHLERKGLITWDSHPNGARYLAYGIKVTEAGLKALGR